MTDDDFREFAHRAFHATMAKNEKLDFDNALYEQWHYDQETAVFTFSFRGKVLFQADFLVAGTISEVDGTWLWGWANEHLCHKAICGTHIIQEFGERNDVLKLRTEKWKADEHDPWEMASVACELLNGEGVYRCPHDTGNGGMWIVLMNVERFELAKSSQS